MNLNVDSSQRGGSTTAELPPTRGVSIKTRVLDYFDVAARGSSLQTELIAGVSTFLALSYIFVVNPVILGQAGMNKSAVLFATIVMSGLATLAMGLWARLPFVLAPGMEMNAYVAFFVVGALGFTWQQALGAVFWSGVLFILFTVTRLREKIIDAVPDQMKSGLSMSVGVFLALVAFKIAGVLRYDGVSLVGLGDLTSAEACILYVALASVLLLDRLRVPGAVMISILGAAGLCHAFGIRNESGKTAEVSAAMFTAIGALDPTVLLQPKMVSVIVILFLIDFYGSVAKLIGLSMNTTIAPAGRVPRLREALLIDSFATTAGSALGTSSLTVYVESGVGIAAGGRTGITAVICGLLMLSCFGAIPFLQSIHVAATTGALLFVAYKLCPSRASISRFGVVDKLAFVLMQGAVILTFALDRAMLIGFGVYLIDSLRQRKAPNVYVALSFLLLLGGALIDNLRRFL